jgi:hypothetical protein
MARLNTGQGARGSINNPRKHAVGRTSVGIVAGPRDRPAGDSDMDETPREKWAMYLGIVATIIPALIASDFMPAWNVLPLGGWAAIAAIGAGIAGAIGTSHWVRGTIAGALTGAGALFGMWLYVIIRTALIGHLTFLKIELVAGAKVGAAPGLLLYGAWSRQPVADDAGHDRCDP